MAETPDSCGARFKDFFSHHWRGFITFVTPTVLLPVMFAGPTIDDKAYWCLFVVLVMCVFWITEALPLYITAMFPIIFMPVMGIMESDFTCRHYFNNAVVLFVGGIIVALSLEYCNLHQRLAMKAILLIGCGPRRIHFGVIVISTFLSMWISNSATTAMMCPIVRGILEELEAQNVVKLYMDESVEPANEEGKKHPSKIAMAFYISVAYGASIGGCATPIGTATNMAFKGIYETRFPNSTEELDFADFLLYSGGWIIIDIILLFLTMEIMHMGLCRPNSAEGKELAAAAAGIEATEKLLKEKYKELGGMSIQEFQIMVIFVMTITLLFFRKPGFMAGWANIFDEKDISDSAAVTLGVLLLFLFPANLAFMRYCGCGSGPLDDKETAPLLSWKFVHVNMSWGLIFLIGGGFALATAMKESGLAKMLGSNLKGLSNLPPLAIQACAVFFGAFFTTFSSNVAICNILIPVLTETAVATRTHPLYLVFPAGLSCSVAFLLPVSTPPNAIVSGYANIKTKYIILSGILPTLSMVLLILINGQTVHALIYPGPNEFPDWADPEPTLPPEPEPPAENFF